MEKHASKSCGWHFTDALCIVTIEKRGSKQECRYCEAVFSQHHLTVCIIEVGRVSHYSNSRVSCLLWIFTCHRLLSKTISPVNLKNNNLPRAILAALYNVTQHGFTLWSLIRETDLQFTVKASSQFLIFGVCVRDATPAAYHHIGISYVSIFSLFSHTRNSGAGFCSSL